MIVLVDGDPIVYRVGFAGQHRIVHAIVDGDPPERYRFEGKTDRNRWLAENPGREIVAEDEEIEVEPLSFVLHSVKQCMGVLEALGETRVFLTGSGNFRLKLAPSYKANRDPNNRPVRYQEIRDYLTDRGALIIDGREADDEISIRAADLRRRRQPYIVATIDKDLDQVPGEHYDYMRHVRYRVSEEDAQKWLWVQILAGDATDGVPGCWKIGQTRATELVDRLYLGKAPQRDIWRAILNEYDRSRGRKGCPYADKDPEAIAIETARLVYMQREPGELWNPPGTPFGRVKGDDDDAE